MSKPLFVEALEPRQLLAATPVYQVWEATEQNTHQSFGITRTYTDASQQVVDVSQTFGSGNPSLNLLLEDVPAHAVIFVGFTLGTSAMHSPTGDSDDLTVTVGGTPIFNDDVSWNDYFIYGGSQISHTGGNLPINFSTSGFESNEVCQIFEMTVGVYFPTITVESEVITVGEFEDVTITAVDEFNNPAQGPLKISGYDSNVIDPQQQTVSVGATGTTTLQVKGINAGESDLTASSGPATNPAATKGTARQIVGNPTLTIDKTAITKHAGQMEVVTLTLRDAENVPLNNRAIVIQSSDPTKADAVTATNITDTNGQVEVLVEAKKATAANSPIVITGTFRTATATCDVTIKGITIAVLDKSIQVTGNFPVASVTVEARDADTGDPVAGVVITATTRDATDGATVSFDNTFHSTDLDGIAVFEVTGTHTGTLIIVFKTLFGGEYVGDETTFVEILP